ncbi:MAG: hypothetical protein KZQ58_05880 [gamma proteobacterium symbiont of Bathyaustriella thionipta]|nr:hypothetical protein [gamma proteobacterium symbiont of Bathyaustriella thionipta]
MKIPLDPPFSKGEAKTDWFEWPVLNPLFKEGDLIWKSPSIPLFQRGKQKQIGLISQFLIHFSKKVI